MKCPVDPDTDLVMSERSGIEIDYCPKCRGVWLDRGELDKIVERAAKDEAGRGATPPHGDPVVHNQTGTRQGQPYRRDDDSVDEDYRQVSGYKKRKPFWMEIFD